VIFHYIFFLIKLQQLYYFISY